MDSSDGVAPESHVRGAATRAQRRRARRLRKLAPLFALPVPAVTLGVAMLFWNHSSCSGTSCVKSAASTWLLGAFSLPTALLGGVPFRDGGLRYALIGATSALVWASLGYLAARRVTHAASPSWRAWWRQYLTLVAGVWAGQLVAAIVLAYAFRHQLFV